MILKAWPSMAICNSNTRLYSVNSLISQIFIQLLVRNYLQHLLFSEAQDEIVFYIQFAAFQWQRQQSKQKRKRQMKLGNSLVIIMKQIYIRFMRNLESLNE